MLISVVAESSLNDLTSIRMLSSDFDEIYDISRVFGYAARERLHIAIKVLKCASLVKEVFNSVHLCWRVVMLSVINAQSIARPIFIFCFWNLIRLIYKCHRHPSEKDLTLIKTKLIKRMGRDRVIEYHSITQDHSATRS